ncbi:MAG: GntR family transcriptional regulator [Oscillospiraceae bacterium]
MIRLDYRDARPIYEQVRDGLRSMMVTGVLAAGDKLPSVRSLATEAGHQSQHHPAGLYPGRRRRDMFTPCRAGARFVSEGQEQNRQRRREATARVLPLMAGAYGTWA